MVEIRAWRAPTTVVLTAIVAVGLLVRLRLWWWDAELANDDILLMTGAAYLGLPELLGPLPNGQGAPPLWLLAERGIAEYLGRGERTLRLLPLVLGCAQVAVFAVLARKALGPVGAVAGTVLVALSPFATLYSATAKQYSADLLVATVLMLVALVVARRGRADWRASAGWWAAAILGGALSHPSLLLAPVLTLVVTVTLLTRGDQERRVRRVAAFGLPGVLWAAGAWWMYDTTLSKVATSGMRLWWADGYRPEGAGVRGSAEFVWRALTTYAREVVLAGAPGRAATVVVVLAALGAVLLAVRDRIAAAVLLAPPAVAVAAALGGVFPLEKRMALWLLPSAVLLVAAVADGYRPQAMAAAREALRSTGSNAAHRLRNATVPRFRTAAAPVVAILGAVIVFTAVAAPVTASAAYELREPGRRDLTGTDPAYADDNRPIITAMRRAHRPGDVLVTMDAQHQATLWYSGRWGVAPYGYLVVQQERACPAGAWLDTAPPAHRYLVIAGTPWRHHHPRSDERALVEDLERIGTVELLDEQRGVRLWAYTPPPQPDRARASRAGTRGTGLEGHGAEKHSPAAAPAPRGVCVLLR